MLNRTVKYVKFHQGIFVPGFGTVGDTLPSSSKTINLTMTHLEEGLFLKLNSTEVLVPWANVVLAVYNPEDKPKVTVKAA